MINELKQLATTEPSKAIDYLLHFIEETIPTKSIFIREAEQGETAEPFENSNLNMLKAMIKQIVASQKASGKNIEQIKVLLLNMEPFNNFPELIEIINNDD